MVEVNKKGKIKVHWKVSPYDYTPDKEKDIAVLMSKKYGIPREAVKVSPDFIVEGSDGGSVSVTDQMVENIQDPAFQEKLFQEYLKINNVEDYDYELISSIDRDINSRIDYQVYDKFRRFSIKWVRFSNFQSYGNDNSFDFRNLHGLVLLNGEPANQSGKTTFAVDLLHFLLFGRTEKADVQASIFNKFLPSETSVVVEGCLCIEGEDYVIRRTLSRPKLERRTEKSKTTQRVEYYRLVGDRREELEDCAELENGTDTRNTNKIIRESIGREEDFDLIMCVTDSTLDSIINEKPTDRGRMFSRWIGLLPLEEKDALAREKFNSVVKPSLLSNQYNRETLRQEVEAYEVEIEELVRKGSEYEEGNKRLEKEIEGLEESRKSLLESKQAIDGDVLKIDITTLRYNKQQKVHSGKLKAEELERLSADIASIGEVDFSVEEYDRLMDERMKAVTEQQSKRAEAKSLQDLIRQLRTSEYCPTCGRKLDNVDNSAQIAEKEKEFSDLVEEGKRVSGMVSEIESKVASMKEMREKYTRLSSLKAQKPILELNIERLRNEYKELVATEREYMKNSEAIDRNNSIDISIRNTDAMISSRRGQRDSNLRAVSEGRKTVEQYRREIARRNDIIKKMDGEEKLVRNWKIYLDMVGRNGISKMVMRKALPVINARLAQLLDDVCDFDVTVDINNKNEVTFRIVKDGVSSDLNSGSGFEKTAAALALRSVLADISTIPRINLLVLDEILGRVSRENYDKMHMLYERIARGHDIVFHITHLEEIKDWHDHIVTVTKSADGVSSLRQAVNGGKKGKKTGNKDK